MARAISKVLAVLPLLLTANEAVAQKGDAVAAEALFQEGRKLLEDGKASEACPKLAESQRLDPATGTLIALAICHEQEGKLASAWAEFSEVEGLARTGGRKDRVALARKRAAALKPRLSSLTLRVSDSVAATKGLTITRDGVEVGRGVWNSAVPLDGGLHTVEVSAPGKLTQTLEVNVANASQNAELEIPALADEPATPAPADPILTPVRERPPSDRGFGGFEWAGIATAGAGAVALGVGGVFLLNALGKKSDSDRDCRGDVCGPAGYSDRGDAVSSGNTATVFGIAGGVLVAGGATLFFVGRSRSSKDPGRELGFSIAPVPAGAAAGFHGAF